MSKAQQVDEDEGAKPLVITLRLEPSLVAALDDYRNSQRFPPSKQVVFERLLVDLLTQHGFWPPKPTVE